MKEREDVVAAIVEAAGGKLTGRVRLQKTVYLLDQVGLKSGFEYDYHHYGPYSRDLDNATADAKAFQLIDEQFDRRQSDGAMYSIFELKGAAKEDAFGDLGPWARAGTREPVRADKRNSPRTRRHNRLAVAPGAIC